MRLLSGHILPRNASTFTCRLQSSTSKIFPRQKPPDPFLQGWEREGEVRGGIKGFLPIKEGEGGKGQEGREKREKKGRGRASGREDLASRS